jgi:hypothetical protein
VPQPGEAAKLNHLCAGLQAFFAHSRPALERLAAAWRAGRPINPAAAQAAPARTAKARPNEPCPCGSGRKFKRCCGA